MANYFGHHCSDALGEELLRAGKDRILNWKIGFPACPTTFQLAEQEGGQYAPPAESGGSLTSDRWKLQLRVNAEQRTVRWRFRIEVADETLPGPDLNMTGGAVGAVDEHRADRRGEWISHR